MSMSSDSKKAKQESQSCPVPTAQRLVAALLGLVEEVRVLNKGVAGDLLVSPEVWREVGVRLGDGLERCLGCKHIARGGGKQQERTEAEHKRQKER